MDGNGNTSSSRKNIRILTWNSNGLLKRKAELKQFLYNENIDIALISKTHLTSWSSAEIYNYKLYTCNHPEDAAHRGSAVYIKNNLIHHDVPAYCTTSIQAACIQVTLLSSPSFNVAAVYSPPKHQITASDYTKFFKHLGERWVIGGDFNATGDPDSSQPKGPNCSRP